MTGYRDAARDVAAIPATGDTLRAWQSGAIGYYTDDRFTVVNLDWLADFSLHIVWFAFGGSQQLHPSPTIETVKGLPQHPPFPEYGMARIMWPPSTAR